jgi:hypothetical protein
MNGEALRWADHGATPLFALDASMGACPTCSADADGVVGADAARWVDP